jgi:hypothetical protein
MPGLLIAEHHALREHTQLAAQLQRRVPLLHRSLIPESASKAVLHLGQGHVSMSAWLCASHRQHNKAACLACIHVCLHTLDACMTYRPQSPMSSHRPLLLLTITVISPTCCTVSWDLPDPAEAEDVVDAVRTEVLRQMRQPPLPPASAQAAVAKQHVKLMDRKQAGTRL